MTGATAARAALINYDGRRFRPIDGDPGGGEPSSGRYPGSEPPAELHHGGELPSGRYHQYGDLVWVEIGGGDVRAGRLVGRVGRDGTLHATYCLVLADGELVAGKCISVPTVLADGRLRLEERWRRLDGSSGISWIEEVHDDDD